MQYRTLEDWLGEVEGYGVRQERMPSEALPWIKTAWELATKAERERCVSIVEQPAISGVLCGTPILMSMAKAIRDSSD